MTNITSSDVFINEMRKRLTFKLVRESFPCFLDSAIRSCCMSFGNCNYKEVLAFSIKGATQDESPLLVKILKIQKSVSVLYIFPAPFWCCANIFPNRTYLEACLTGFLHSRYLVNLLGNAEIFCCVFASIWLLLAAYDVIQVWLNAVAEVTEDFGLLGAGLDVVCKLLAKGILRMVVWAVGVDWCRFADITFLRSVLGFGGNCCSSVVAWSGL